MPFTPISSERVADSVVRQIELLILRGLLRPGERLPAERDLAERLGVSRPSLRDAVAILQQRGLLDTKPGSGMFVAAGLDASFPRPLIRLFSAHDEAVFDYLQFRRDMESLAAERAARLASDTDLAVITAIVDKMDAATDREAALQDAEFHMAIFEASHNVVLLHMMRAMFDLLQEGVFYNRQAMFRQRTTRAALLEQHKAIHRALLARDPEGSREAVLAHIDYVEQTLKDLRRSEHNEAVAKLRLGQEAAS